MTYSITSFQWKNRNGWTDKMSSVVVTAFTPKSDDSPALIIESLGIWTDDNRQLQIDLTFAMEDGSDIHQSDSRIYKFVHDTIIRAIPHGSSCHQGYTFSLSHMPKSGEPITEAMMKAYLAILMISGAYSFTAPRIITETFSGRRGDKGSLGYGQQLMNKVIREAAS